MKKILFIAIITVAATVQAQVSKNVNSFKRLLIDSNATVEIIKSNDSKVQFTGNAVELDQIITKNDSEVLKIQSKENDLNQHYRIYTNDLVALQIDGNAKVTFKGFDSLKVLSIKTTKDSNVDLGKTLVANLVINRNANSSVKVAEVNTKTEIVDGKTVSI